METITIPYEDYKELLEESNMYKDMNRELQFILKNCSWNIYRQCLNLENDLSKRTEKFMKEEENKNE